MSSYEKKSYPIGNGQHAVSYEVTDDYGHTAQLTPEQVYDLLDWLLIQKEELSTLIYGTTEEPPPTR